MVQRTKSPINKIYNYFKMLRKCISRKEIRIGRFQEQKSHIGTQATRILSPLIETMKRLHTIAIGYF